MTAPFGRQLPHIVAPPPGPASRALAGRLRRVESRNITHVTDDWPVFWQAAAGANVRDADGNIYVDLTAGFGVASAGHAAPTVAEAVARQVARLPHGLGDVHPSAVKVELLERLAAIAPGPLGVSILGLSGADAVEAALKTAVLATGRSAFVAFSGGYHGLSIGTLAVTDRPASSEPFAARLAGRARLARFPDPLAGVGTDDALADASAAIRTGDVAAVLVEAIQGRAGIVVPPADFLPRLRALCDQLGVLLVVDEIYTGLGRTGRWFACELSGVVPDIVTVGKALSGALPISAAIASPELMRAWPESGGEALHTSTFLGNPTACAAALAQLRAIEEQDLLARADALGRHVARRTNAWVGTVPGVRAARGVGLMQGIVLERASDEGAADDPLVKRLLRRGILALTEGPSGDVLAITPPLVIEQAQLDHALDVIEEELRR